MHDIRDPNSRLGQALIEEAGFQFDEKNTAICHVERLGGSARDVRQVVLTHADPDHAGGLADFPWARVQLAAEESANIASGNPRYLPAQFDHGPAWSEVPPSSRHWFGLEARSLNLGFDSEVLLIPLFGHTRGHCGVAIEQNDQWLLHVGDAYYLRAETVDDAAPSATLAELRADDDLARRASLKQIRRLLRDHSDEVTLFGYHDPAEFPTSA